jgi:hypothetical protein
VIHAPAAILVLILIVERRSAATAAIPDIIRVIITVGKEQLVLEIVPARHDRLL